MYGVLSVVVRINRNPNWVILPRMHTLRSIYQSHIAHTHTHAHVHTRPYATTVIDKRGR